MTRSKWGRSGACALLVLVLAGCSTGPATSPDEKAVRSTILKYNELLAAGYRSMNMTPMLEVATQAQAESEYIHMSSLAEGGVRLDPTLVSLDFVTVSVEATSAQVETRETWDYRHYQRDTGALLLEQKGLIYELAYDLEKQEDGRWLVSDVRAISSTATVEPTVIATPTAIPPGH